MAEQDNNLEGYGSYQNFLDKVGRAQDRMSLGSQTLKEYYSPSNIVQRGEYRAKMFGFSGDGESQYSRQEQMAMARSDMFSKIATTGNAATFGLANVGSSLLQGGSASMQLGKASMYASLAGGAGQATGMGGASGFLRMGGMLGSASNMFNGPMLAANLAIKGGEFFATHGIIDPYVNASMFQGTAMSSMRGVLGGSQSRLGSGGLSMTESLGIGKSVRNLQMGNRDISADQMNALMSQAGSMPQMQFATSPDQAMQNIQKVVEFGAKITKYFGEGKGKEALQTIAQLGTMGMNIDQATRAFEKTQQMGTFLNTDPSKIMNVGASATQMAMGTGISQGTLFNTGIQNYERAQRMIQGGAISQTQAQNFGGAEGIAQLTTGIQMKFFESRLGESALRSMYADGTSDEDSMKKMALGQMSLGEQRRRSTNITLSPRENMDFQMDKDNLISNMGENTNSIFFNQLNKLSSNKNPYGSSLQGRAKWMMATGMVQDKQQAMLMAQQWMQDPAMEQIRKDRQTDQMMEQNDPFYSSGTQVGRGMSYAGRWMGRTTDFFKRDFGLTSAFNSESQSGGQMRNAMFGVANMMGLGSISNWFRETTNTRDSQTMDMPFGKIANSKEFRDTVNSIREDPTLGGSYDPRQEGVRNEARSLSYAQLENYRGADKDAITDIRNRVKEDSVGMTGTSEEKAVQLMKKYGISETATVKNLKNVDVGYKKIVQGSLLEQTLSSTEKEDLQNLNLKLSSPSGIKLQGEYNKNWGSIAANVGIQTAGSAVIGGMVGSSLPIIGTTAGAIIGGLVGLYNGVRTVSGELAGGEEYKNIQSKFGTSDLKTQLAMAEEMKTISEGSQSSEIRGDEATKLMFGTQNKSVIKQMYEQNSSLAALTDKSEKGNLLRQQLQKKEKMDDVRKGVDILYGGNYYKSLSMGATGNDKTIKSLVDKFVFDDNTGDSNLKITSDQYSKMKEQFKGKAGIGDVLKNTKYDEATGTVQIKEGISKRERDLALNNIYAAAGGGVNNAEKLWEQKMTAKANSIQDFATAVAKGMQMFTAGTMEQDWNNVAKKEDKQEIKK